MWPHFFQVFNVILWTPIAQLVNKLQMIKKQARKIRHFSFRSFYLEGIWASPNMVKAIRRQLMLYDDLTASSSDFLSLKQTKNLKNGADISSRYFLLHSDLLCSW
jgi:hypothetical protein